MPKAVLAAIILQSVLGLFERQEAQHLWKVHKSDFWMMAATFLITLILGIEEGVFAGVILSVLVVLYKSSRPHIVVLGKIPGTTLYRNIDRFGESETTDDIMILRFDDQLYYGNANFFKDFIRAKVNEAPDSLTHIVLDTSSMHDMDSSGAHAFQDIQSYLTDKGIDIHLSGSVGPLRDMLAKCGMMEDPHKHHMNVHGAVSSIRNTPTL